MIIKADSLTRESIVSINGRFEDGAIRDGGALDYIIYKVSKTRGINRKAATLLIEITTKHPFFDGNKRTAIESTKVLLAAHNKKITVKDNTIFDLIFRITSRRYRIDEATMWIANHTK